MIIKCFASRADPGGRDVMREGGASHPFPVSPSAGLLPLLTLVLVTRAPVCGHGCYRLGSQMTSWWPAPCLSVLMLLPAWSLTGAVRFASLREGGWGEGTHTWSFTLLVPAGEGFADRCMVRSSTHDACRGSVDTAHSMQDRPAMRGTHMVGQTKAESSAPANGGRVFCSQEPLCALGGLKGVK